MNRFRKSIVAGLFLVLGSCAFGQSTKIDLGTRVAGVLPAANGGAPVMVPGAQALYMPYLQNTTTATTLTDYSGNGYTGTFSATPPTWIPSGAGLVFASTSAVAVQSITIPAAALNGAKTVEIWGSFSVPAGVAGGSSSAILSDTNQVGIMQAGAFNGQLYFSTPQQFRGVDRYIGNSGIAITIPTPTTPVQYINGKHVSGQLNYAWTQGTSTVAFTSTNPALIGDNAAAPGQTYYATFILYGMATYNTALTAAQIAQNDIAFKSLIGQAKGIQFPAYTPTSTYIAEGDSRMVNFGLNYALATSVPYPVFKNIGVDDWTALGIGGQTQANIMTNLATREYPVIDGTATSTKVVWDEAGINDDLGGTAAATTLANLKSYCTALHGRYPGIKVMVSTHPPRSDAGWSTTLEAIRETLNTSLVSAWLGGTLVCDGLGDDADNPIAATQATPNNFVPTAALTHNATYYPDGVHYSAVMSTNLASCDTTFLLDAMGRLNKPNWCTISIPAAVLATFANSSQVLTLMQLGPGWQVCGMKASVGTAFAGTGITALTMTAGDSTGTATQYLPSQSLLSAGGQLSSSPNYVSNHGVVQATFASTGANMSALTAGAMNIDVCVVNVP
jgi:hypothetical protein